MEQEVTKCSECPMFASHFDGWGGCHCNHPETAGDDLESFKTDYGFPDWCPLKKEEITIKLKNIQL